ncbi:MAG: L-seryl-tRNA(Sec) selenium transferase [Proteobacteria bacterium]|nr:L-seryl-tRNA(Sec) selenium transferase [Pseudomonadota bacterium]
MQSVPSVDQLARSASANVLLEKYGHDLVMESLRAVTAQFREALLNHGERARDGRSELTMIRSAQTYLETLFEPSLKSVFNLTGTVLHTNLGRAPLPPEAIEAMTVVARGASNLEFDLGKGRRGDRDVHLEQWLCRLTSAQAATTVNNNAAAVLLVLNTLALRKEVIVSRGELIEIGGSFRIPDVMARAGCKLREVGTTNRTHAADFEQAIGPKTAMLMKVHTSNYVVEGFTASVPESELAEIAHRHELPFVVDLGSGTLVDLSRYGLPHEPTVAETLANGADLVTFSGDKLLGGPQAGIIAGRSDLIDRINRNPMKRALRIDKMTIAALEAVLSLYGNPDRLAERSTTLRLLTRTQGDIEAQATRLRKLVERVLSSNLAVNTIRCQSQIGSGAQPGKLLASAGLAIRPSDGRASGKKLEKISVAFRRLPIPVIGRIEEGAFLLDLRCLEDEADFIAQLSSLGLMDVEP